MGYEVRRRVNAFVDLSSTDLTTLYTCPTNKTAVIKEIFICNTDSTNSTDITIAITDTSASTTFNLIKTKTVGNDDFLTPNGWNACVYIPTNQLPIETQEKLLKIFSKLFIN